MRWRTDPLRGANLAQTQGAAETPEHAMPAVYTLLTLDVEIFGNGTGDILYCMIEPTRQLLQILARHDVRVTLFPDVCLLWAIDENERSGAFAHLGYSPGAEFRKLLTEALAAGHDVQLHAHPEFTGATYKGLQFVVPEKENWRITALPEGTDCRPLDSIDGIIGEGKRTLARVLKESAPDHEITTFRAGMLCSRPEEALFRALRRHGIRFDLSGAFGFRIDTGVGSVDFTDAFRSPDPVPVGATYLERSPLKDLIALPIYGAPYYPWSELGVRIKRKLGLAPKPPRWRRQRPRNCSGSAHNPGYVQAAPRGILGRVVSPPIIHFFLESSADDLLFCARDAIARAKRTDRDVYLVGLGHPKAMGDLSQLDVFLRWAREGPRREVFQFLTTADLASHQFGAAVTAGVAVPRPTPVPSNRSI